MSDQVPNPTSTDVDDRRDRGRQPPEVEPTYVWVSLESRFKARVIDESEGGIGVITDRAGRFELGFQVRVEHAEGRRTARIVYVEDLDETTCRVGLAWES